MADAPQDPWEAAGFIPAAQDAPQGRDPWEAAGFVPAQEAPQHNAAAPANAGNNPKGALQAVPANSFLGRIRDAFTGANRTEYPDAPEFLQAAMQGGVKLEDINRPELANLNLSAIHQSAVTPDPNAQLDILRKNIPGLETRQDRHGNVMLRAPLIGVNDWAYLNRPGMSQRDFDEFMTQTLATLPFLGVAGTPAATVAGTAARSGLAMGGASVFQDKLAELAGSEQGVDWTRAGISTGVGALTSPGVPTAIARGVADTVNAATSPVTNYVRAAINPRGQAARNVAESFVADAGGQGARLTPEQAQHLAANRLQIADAAQGLDQVPGGQATLMDVGGTRTRALARSAANISPEARQTIEGVINPRFETQTDRTMAFMDALLPGPTANQSREALQQLAATARAPFYERAFQAGSRGVQSPELDALMQSPAVQNAMGRAATEMQNRAAAGRLRTAVQGPGGYTLEFWDQVKRVLQDNFTELQRNGRNAEAGNLGGILGRLIGSLDRAVPSYRQARGVAEGIFGAQDALEAGRNFVTSRMPNHEAEQALEQMTPVERDLFARGFVEHFIERVSQVGDRRNLMNMIANSPAARERLETALGPHAARELETFVRAERVLDLARSAVQGNSTTARQLMELGLAGAATGAITGFDPQNPVTYLAAILTHRGVRSFHARVDARVANEVANMLVSRDPAIMRQGLQRIAHGPMFEALRAFDRRVSGPARGAAMSAINNQLQSPPAPNANAMVTPDVNAMAQ